MFEIITSWNITRPERNFNEEIKNIELRGYDKKTFLTGEFARKIARNEVKSLSVSDIADFLCPTRRDLYIKKGKNRPKGRKNKKTWGSVAGRVVENFLYNLIIKRYRINDLESYFDVVKRLDRISKKFKSDHRQAFINLDNLKSRPDEKADWLLNLLNYNGRIELSLKLLNNILSKEKDEIEKGDIKIDKSNECELRPRKEEIGISSPVRPDFIIENKNAVGDIKSSIGGFKEFYLLTCAGYALAYENQTKKDINYGIIYFFPTRYSKYAKPVSFAQIYIFSIDDNLRRWFKDIRNEAYAIIEKDSPPDFPEEKDHCSYCQFYDICKKQGLKL